MPWHVQIPPEPAMVVTMAERRSAWADTAVNLVRLWSLWSPRVPWQQGELCMAAMGPEQLLPQQAAQNPCRGTLTPAGQWDRKTTLLAAGCPVLGALKLS